MSVGTRIINKIMSARIFFIIDAATQIIFIKMSDLN